MNALRKEMAEQDIMKEMFVKDDHDILDVCCGTGDWTIQLAEEAPEAEVVGLDFSEKMLEVAEKN